MIEGIGRILPLLVGVPNEERFRSIIADDAEIEDGVLFSPEAFAAIRSGQAESVAVPENVMAIDGRKIREFLPVWERIIGVLGLSEDAKIRPVAEVTSRDINDSIGRLVDARAALLDTLPKQTKKRALWPWVLAATGVSLGAVLIARESTRNVG